MDSKIKLSVMFYCFCVYMVDSRGIAGNVKLVAMNGNQYWFSSSSPYAPSLNYHLAYQYCRTLGLQLVVLETKEEVETISAYLNSADGSTLNQNKYWTSGNRLGADTWIWMSNGEQLNSSFSDYWLKSGNGSPADNPKQCMSMKAPITKRAIFNADECGKSYPFICEQVRCLYYNYPVQLFPDPSDLRADIEDGTLATPSESESRSSTSFLPSASDIRSLNSFSGRNFNLIQNQSPSTLSDIALESSRTDPQRIQRRVTLRPVQSAYPFPPSYINSFYKYKSIDYTQTSTERPSFKKTTRESLWGPTPFSNSTATTAALTATTSVPPTASGETSSNGKILAAKLLGSKSNSHASISKPTIYVTGKVLRPSNSSVATTVETSVRKEQKEPQVYTHLEIVTSKSTHINGEEVTEPEIEDEKEEEAATLFLTRYGTGSSGGQSNEYISTLPSVVFDEEQNNVGAEVVEVEEETETETPPPPSKEMFFQGNGIRRPDTQSVTTWKSKASGSVEEEPTTTIRVNVNSNEKDREASQVHSPATMKMYEFQRNKSPVSWAKDKKSGRSLASNTNAGPSQIRLGPRLRFRLKNSN